MPMRFYACMGVCCNSPLLGRKGVRKMSYSKEHKEHIEYTFAAFCKVVLRNAALSAYRDIGRRRKHEISLDYLMSERYYNPSVTDNYFEEVCFLEIALEELCAFQAAVLEIAFC